MASVSSIAGVQDCSFQNILGTGDKNCPFKLDLVVKVYLSKKGYKYSSITDFTAEALALEVQAGNITPLPRLFNFERLTEENVRETSQSGNMALARKGKYSYKLTWNNDDQLQEVMTSLDSNGRYDIVLIDSSGNMKLAKDGVNIKGASIGMFDTDPFMESDGSTTGKVSVVVQLDDPSEYNSNAEYISRSKINFNPLNVEGSNDIDLTITAFASGATSISFTAFLKDGSTAFTAGTDADFKLTINGVTETITGNVSNDGATYTIASLTALATNDVITLSTIDTTVTPNTVAIIKDGVDVYSGKEVTVTVA